MPSEKLASAENLLKGNLASAWNILEGSSGDYTDLGIARRFGGSAAAYSLRDIGAMNGRVVKVRRDSGETTDPEEDFSANQVQSGALEDWVNGKLESTLPADVDTAAAAYSLRKVKASYTEDAVRIRRSSDDAEVNVAFDLDDKVSTSSSISVVSGTVTDTTLGDFISGTDAFVHTWYDQAGSNDAVQATASKQPKIASSGALLSDGLTFDGSNDFLQTSTQVLTGTETGANSMYAVIKQTSGDAGYICGSAANPSGADQIGQSLYADGATNNKIVLTNGNDADTADGDNIPTIEGQYFLISSNYSNNNTSTLHSNANSNGYTDGTDAYDFNAGDRFTIAARKDSTSAAAVLFDGSMKEIIAYDSDQSDNRFKIESNINNYYGLYNDENDLAGNFTVDSAGSGTDASISNESKTGFTATVVDKAGFFGADLNEAVPNGSNLYISFNANLSPSGGTAATPNFGLADSSDKTGNSTGNPLDTAVVEGFNSITVAGTTSTCDRIRFTEGNDNVSFIISDLKVSRIARNGFVETWYDQSGNGIDATQIVASNQPHIVINGGLVKNSGGLPTLLFARTAVRSEDLNFSGPNVDNTSFYVVNEQTRNFSNALASNVGGSFRVRFGRYFDPAQGNKRTVELEVTNSGESAQHIYDTVNLNTQPAYGLYLGYLKFGATSKVGFNTVGATGTITSSGTYNWNKIFRGDNQSGDISSNHKIPEVIIYSGDKLVDTDLADEIKSYYNI